MKRFNVTAGEFGGHPYAKKMEKAIELVYGAVNTMDDAITVLEEIGADDLVKVAKKMEIEWDKKIVVGTNDYIDEMMEELD